MGSGIGKVLVQEGYQILTCLEGRSTLTKELAQKAGFQDTPNLATLLSQSDCLISIVPPESALSVAQGIAVQIQSANPGMLGARYCVNLTPTLESGDDISAAWF